MVFHCLCIYRLQVEYTLLGRYLLSLAWRGLWPARRSLESAISLSLPGRGSLPFAPTPRFSILVCPNYLQRSSPLPASPYIGTSGRIRAARPLRATATEQAPNSLQTRFLYLLWCF